MLAQAAALANSCSQGDAVLFYAMTTDGKETSGSLHGSCDVINGTKFSAPVWIRQNAFHLADLPPDGPTPCKDKESSCKTWQQNGECTKNAAYMEKSCMKACGICTGDWV
jgi:hypothetical protein